MNDITRQFNQKMLSFAFLSFFLLVSSVHLNVSTFSILFSFQKRELSFIFFVLTFVDFSVHHFGVDR